MVQAIWNGQVIAESDETILVEGNHYFPPAHVRTQLLRPSDHTSVCSWKGVASYYHVEVDGEANKDAAWYYPEISEEGARRGIKGYIAFWKGVEVE